MSSLHQKTTNPGLGPRPFLLKVLILLLLALPTGHTRAGSTPLEAITDGLGKLIGGITNINIESTTLGIDKGIIAGAVLGIGRTVERNPFPTGVDDQYLVKDRMRLGYELGAGLVLAGTLSYVQEWTLVYPVATSLKGTLSRKFLVDLFLPLRVKEWTSDKLPRDFALIRESFIEGKGRLKAGGVVPFMVGNQLSYGKVQLESLITRHHKDGTIKAARELSSYYRLAYELWVNLILFDLPVFESYRHKGEVVRNYIDLPRGKMPRAAREKLFQALFTGKNLAQLKAVLKDETITRKVQSQFTENYSSLTFFGLFNKDSFSREDYVTDIRYRDNEDPEVVRWWQNLDRHYHDWTTGIESELYRSDLQFSGKPILNKEHKVVAIERPQLRIKLSVKDENTSKEEYEDDFVTMAESLMNERPQGFPLINSWQDLIGNRKGSETKRPETLFTLEVHLNSDQLHAILKSRENDWYNALEDLTGKSKDFWDRAARGGFHSDDRRRLRRNRPTLGEVHLAKKIITINRYLKRARQNYKEDPLLSYRYLNWSIRRMFHVGSSKKNSSWDLRLLKAIASITQSKPWVGANLRIFVEKEANEESPTLDHIIQLSSANGTTAWEERPEYNFLLNDPSEIYHFFEEVSFL